MKTKPHNHKPMNKQGSDTTFDPHKPRIIANCLSYYTDGNRL
jgi:hypothetical protein